MSWNNNVAENAVKVFVSRRRVIGTAFTEGGVGDYLLFLSIYCTLKRYGVSLLKFLRSGETDIDAFVGNRARTADAAGIDRAIFEEPRMRAREPE